VPISAMLSVPFLGHNSQYGFPNQSTWRPIMSTLISKRTKASKAQSGRCFYCNAPMCEGDPKLFAAEHGISPAEAKRLRPTAEHLKARCDGGKDSMSNIVAACLHCNMLRHARRRPPSPDRYRAHVSTRIVQGRWHSPRIHDRFFKVR
jgi:hypothetical protein